RAVGHLDLRRQPADRLAVAGGHRQHPHGAGAAGRVRLDRQEGKGVSDPLVVEVLAGAVAGGTCILYAAVGESFSESAGVVNLGTEGSMLCGALAAYAVAAETGSYWIGALGGAIAGGLLATVHAYFVLNRRSNQLATGLVVMFLGLGITSLF